MNSNPQHIENSGFSGWPNAEEDVIKNGQRQTKCRKRGYELANINFNGQCEHLTRNVLRPENETDYEMFQTRPVDNKRVRQWQLEPANAHWMTERRSEPPNVPQPSLLTSEPALFRNQNDLPLLHTLAAYNWSQHYLNRIQQQVAYQNHRNLYMNRNSSPQDQWILYNYLLAASFHGANTNEVSPQMHNANPSEMRMSEAIYSNMILEMNRSRYLHQQHTELIDRTIANSSNLPSTNESRGFPNQTIRSRNFRSNSADFFPSQLMDTSPRNPRRMSQENGLFSEMYSNDSRFSNSLAYGYICPFHCQNHSIHNSDQLGGQVFSSNPLQRNTFNFHNTLNALNNTSSSINLEAFWPQIIPIIRPVNYPLNMSNISALIHLAGPFEKRKNGITKEELDQLPTHRYRTSMSDKTEKSSSSENGAETCLKCLVCLEDFEPKQNIRVLRCEHEFHAKCIDKWLKINRTCPLCRADAFDGSAQKDGM